MMITSNIAKFVLNFVAGFVENFAGPSSTKFTTKFTTKKTGPSYPQKCFRADMRVAYTSPMRPILTVLIFLAAVFLLGALIAPWLYWGAQSAGQAIPFLHGLAHQPFHRFVR